MQAFLGRDAFPGPALAAPVAPTSFAGQARFNGCIAICNWRRDAVAAALPPELELAANRSRHRHWHPVVFIFGEQIDGATIFGGITVPMGVRYDEVAFAVPFVRRRDGERLHIFIPRMYSSYFPATWTGNAHYGLAKVMARMEWRGGCYTVTTLDGVEQFRGVVEPAGPWIAARDCTLRSLVEVQGIFALPIAGRRGDGRYVGSFFGWDFAAARVRPVRATVSIPSFAGAVAPRSSTALAAGTFEVAGMRWRLSWPQVCHP